MDNQILCSDRNTAEACRLFRRLSGLTVSAFAKKINVSHTYWKDLESGLRDNPSLKVKTNIAAVTGLSVNSVEYLLEESHLGSEDIYRFLIESLEEYLDLLKVPKA